MTEQLSPQTLAGGLAGFDGTPDRVERYVVGAGGRLVVAEVAFVDFGAENWTPRWAMIVWDVAAARRLWHRSDHDERWGAFRLSDDEATLEVEVDGQVVTHDAWTGAVLARRAGS